MTAIHLESVSIGILNHDRPRLRRIASWLQDEIAGRSGLRWEIGSDKSATVRIDLGVYDKAAGIGISSFRGIVAPAQANPEGFEMAMVREPGGPFVIRLLGSTDRGAVFAVGYLLRQLDFGSNQVRIRSDVYYQGGPKFPIRGHQLGYRPKNNTYDAWNVDRYQRYILDLAIFGGNAIELMPPKTDDQRRNALMVTEPLELLAEVSQFLDDFDLLHYLWYPAMADDYSNMATQATELAEWAEVFAACKRLDAIFVPGGDPGHTPPEVLFPFLERVSTVLHRHHPNAGIWLSPQGFSVDALHQFYERVRSRPDWLSGVVYGPLIKASLPEFRRSVGDTLPIRLYPDIGHCLECQFPVPDWDVAYAMTLGREPIDPRPCEFDAVAHEVLPGTVGFVSYSEGANDDLNKFVWTQTAWDLEHPISSTVYEYAKILVDDPWAAPIAQQLFALERNWQGSLLANDSVQTAFYHWSQVEPLISDDSQPNWRLDFVTYRTYYDAYIRMRLLRETTATQEALWTLINGGPDIHTVAEKALAILTGIAATEALAWLHQQLERLAHRLFETIGIQLSVTKYYAIGGERGATLDSVDHEITDNAYIIGVLEYATKCSEETARQVINGLLQSHYVANPGAVTVDLGVSHTTAPVQVVRPADSGITRLDNPHPTFVTDFFGMHGKDPHASIAISQGKEELPELALPMMFRTALETKDGSPLTIRISHLSPRTSYRLRGAYYGRGLDALVLRTKGRWIHGPEQAVNPPRWIEYEVPEDAIDAGGTLELTWESATGSLQIASIWLIPTGPFVRPKEAGAF